MKTNFIYRDLEKYLPKRDYDEMQTKFFKDAFELITTDRDTNKVTCLADRCGIGKSTFLKAFIHCCLSNSNCDERHEPQGLVVVTDSIKRLEELSSSKKDMEEAKKFWGEYFEELGIDYHYKRFEKNVIVLKAGESFKDQLIRQHYCPVVLLSTQRYFMLSDSVREQLFKFQYNDKPMKRDIVIFDEAPVFFETVTIDSDNLTRIESALYKGLSDEVKDKPFVIKEFKVFKDRLLDQMDEKEKLSKDSNVIIYWKDERYSTITPNDDILFKVIAENVEQLTHQYANIIKDMGCLQEIAKNGAIFTSVKKKHGNYERSFKLVRDNRDYFYLGQDKKFFVFDATADIDPHYDLDYVEIISGDQYSKPLDMSITNVRMSTSKNTLCNGSKKSNATTTSITNYLKKKLRSRKENQEDILIVVYSDLQRRFQKDFDKVAYFGNLKGFNDYKDMTNMAHIGMNRFPNMEYFFMYCGCHMEIYRELMMMEEDESMKFFDTLSKNHNKKFEKAMTDVMLRCMIADFEQNIFRLAIRNYMNTSHVQVWTFYKSDDEVYKQLSDMLEDRYKKLGVVFEYEDTPEELQIELVKNRKPPHGKEMTNAQKVLQWCNKQVSGTEFKVSELLKGTGLTNDSFKEIRKSNQAIKKMFDQMQTDKRGYYKIG